MYGDRDALRSLRFRAAQRDFEPEPDSVVTEGAQQRCPRGMEYNNDNGVCGEYGFLLCEVPVGRSTMW